MDDFSRYLPSWAEAAPAAAGVLGRLMYHFEQVRRGRRPAIGLLLSCEVAIAVPMGYLGKGLASYLGLTGDVAFAAVIAVAYLGPRLIEIALERLLERSVGGQAKPSTTLQAEKPAETTEP